MLVPDPSSHDPGRIPKLRHRLAKTPLCQRQISSCERVRRFLPAERGAPHFPGRIGIVHRDLPEMVARGYVDAAFTQYHLISYWTRIFPRHFEFVPVSDAEQFFVKIAFGRVIDPLRPRALRAFDEFFFDRARDVYPRYDFARMNDDEYGATLGLDS